MTASTGAAATNTVLHQTTFNAGTTLFRLEGLTQTQASVIDLGQIVRSPTALANIATVPGSGVVNIRGDYTLSNGIIGGWATAQNSATKNENVYDWATIDANRNIVPFTAYQTKNDLSTWGINDNININSTAILNSAANVTINSLRTAVGGVYTLSFSGAVNIASGGVLIEGSTASSVTFAGAGPITSSSGELILNSAGASKLLTISASIADPDGSTHLNLIKTQAGTVVILGSHTYSGDVYINQGTLQIDTMANTGQPSSLGTSGTIYLGGFGGPGTINFGVGANGAIVGNNTSDRAFVFGAGGAIFRNGGGTVILTGPMSGVGQFTRFGVGGWTSILGSKTYSGSTVVGAGTLDVNVIANTGQPSGLGTGADIATIQLGNQNAACLNYSGLVDASTDRPFAISAAGQSIRVENNSTPVTLTLTGPLSGASSLQKLGSGTLAISGSKTYSGSLTIGQGALSIDNAGGVGTGAAANSSTITLGSNNSATLSFTGASGNISRPFLLNPDVTGVFEATSGSLGLSGQIDTNGKALVFGGAGNFAVNGAVIGGGSLTKNGAGSLILNGTNTYSGGSTLNGGTTVIGNDTALGNTSGGITFDSGQLLASASVASARTILLNAGGGAINTSASSSFSGAISGSGNLTKLGTSTLTLSGNNTTTGNTIIQAGNLEMVGSNAWNPALNGPGVTSIQSGQLILNYSGGSSPADPSFKTKLHDSYVSGFTSGQFRAPAADARHGLGWVDDGASKVSIAFTYYGDANLDKVVDSGDFTLLSQNFNSTVGVWGLGDFNYDGFVNALDFNSIATNYGATPIPGSSLGALVPEPSAISLLALGLWVRHRKPKHRSDKAARI
jgi:autotransporter-associated beta strand protein